ncbi:MAG: helix-turn-helix domain-containing protein [Candidatus Magasanikbacteria bacterium]|jgi:sugar-specific transcriptional regulator TrmB
MKIEKALESCGLNQRESQIYLALLQIGPSPVQKIAQKSGFPRSTVYEILDELAKKSFVSGYLKKKIKYYNAEEPSNIVALAQNKVTIIKNVLPELEALSGKSRNRPTVRFYQGREQMRIVLDEILKEADELCAFSVAEDLLNVLGDYHTEFLRKRIKNRIPLRIILRDSATARERQRLGPQQLRTVKLMSNKYEFHGLMYIWKNKFAMFSLANDFVAVVTESKELADIEKAKFNNLWNLL